MKLGPLYLLWSTNWIDLMHTLEANKAQLDHDRRELERLNQQLQEAHAELTQRGDQIARLTEEVEELRGRRLRPIPRDPSQSVFVESPTPKPSPRAMIEALDGWTTQFQIDGEPIGGPIPLSQDVLLEKQLGWLGGVEGKRILELGPLDGGHTYMLCRAGAREVVAVEGFREAWMRCLVVKEVFDLKQARFLYGDFCEYVNDPDNEKFDVALARGVLYHQSNPAALIHGLTGLADAVIVWSQVADDTHPTGDETTVEARGFSYRGRVNDYDGARNAYLNYCGGVHPTSVWLYPDELRRAFRDAGFSDIMEEPTDPTPSGPAVQFVARRGSV